MRLPDALIPLRDTRFAWYYTGRFISMAGSTMAPLALTFAVLDLTDSPARSVKYWPRGASRWSCSSWSAAWFADPSPPSWS